ncbi:hypothetical protein SAMN05216226_10281 [Halovenus aranensis]|jgi:hypothetical protein|uniref:DUF3194 domain-containing protein n=1 Tax=Halovenus aranensis TaxID=890420 RepID=A0A1G8SPH2_9EURY|nr:DUF3194 domain-containing protein [Halovenus aranensis]SDJ31107.1 hypothetical protein SAMN05216226_10281 [Halovenus aranensis]
MSDDGVTGDAPDDETVVQTAADAAEDVIFSRYDRSAVSDLDITVTFEDEMLEVDIYLDAEEGRTDAEQVTEDAALAARSAVDDLLL